MTLWTLALRSLRFHARAHLGVLLGATVGAAVLIGALLVGDSVRGSLRDMALARLGKVEAAMATGDRLFRTELATNLNAAPVLALPGTVNSADSSRRANRVHVLGVDESFWKLATKAPPFATVPPDSVVLNQALADQLAAKPGDEVLLRVSKVSALSQDVALTTRDGQSVAVRLRVYAVVGKEQLGRFSLQANQIAPFNAFVPLGLLQAKADAVGKANLSATLNTLLFPSREVDISFSAEWATENFMAIADAGLRHSWQLADAQLELRPLTNSAALELRTDRIFLDPPAVRAALAVDTNAQPILTYLATLLRAGTNATAYPMVTAAGAPLVPADLRDDEVVINQWLADQLQLKPGGELEMSYFLPDSGAALTEATNRFRVHSIVPMQMPWADRTLMPDFPGIAKAERIGDWDAGFPMKHSKLVDDPYWKQWRGTPKAFVSLSAGRKMWGNRFGDTTAIRFPMPQSEIGNRKSEIEKALLTALKPTDFGLVFQPVREQALKASREGQDFGGLFIGFSFFLIIAACVLVSLLFQFGIEQRATEVGTLLALGFTPKQVRRLFLLEGAGLSLLGSLLGAAGGVWYARAMLHALSTVWRDAVGTSDLNFHAEPATLAGGIVGSVLVAVFTLWLALRKQARRPARELLAGGGEEVISNQCSVISVQSAKGSGGGVMAVLPHPGPLPLGEGMATGTLGEPNGSGSDPALAKVLPLPAGEGRGEGEKPRGRQGQRNTMAWTGVGCLLAALALIGWAWAKNDSAAAGIFFGAGALLLGAAMAFTSAFLSKLERSEAAANLTLTSLGIRNATRRRRRSLATVAMLACGSFLIVSIGAFRLDEHADATKRASGTGGFALLGESTLPVVQDLNSPAGREFFNLDAKAMTNVSVVPFRVRDGDDASCLNLNRAQKPRLLGVQWRPMDQRTAFRFAGVWKPLKNNSGDWMLLSLSDVGDGFLQTMQEAGLRRASGGSEIFESGPSSKSFGPPPGTAVVIPGVADEASILWALGKKLGDTVDFTDERGKPFKVRLVAALAGSVLQGNLIIAEDEFTARYPGEAGYRFFLVDAPPERAAEVSATLTKALRDFGLELTPTTRRLAQFNAVQNTYLGTFQVLGGLGLLLGSAGLGVVVLRNVLERRGELALLLAVGFRAKALRWLVLSEHAGLLLLGLGAGVVAAAVAVLPALRSGGDALPLASLGLTLAGVLVSGLVFTLLATTWSLRGKLLDALRSQ
ncbi:MAG: hypothetical protein RL514_2043 [Verrucomicrobiota bacterium]|jgi:ABC-type antimicrobial peptide transport system permease subunit